VLDTGAVTRGSGSKNEDKERNIRKWFVDRDLIDGVILLAENLFYNTGAPGVILVLNKRKLAARKGKIVLLNVSKRLKKGKPKNYIPEEAIRPLAAAYLKGEPLHGEIAVITRKQAEVADYNLSLETKQQMFCRCPVHRTERKHFSPEAPPVPDIRGLAGSLRA
jgi:type I restriction enzyme M protein